jgi:uncharacterized protein DUF4340
VNRQRFIALLVAALVVISGALYLSSRRNETAEQRGGALLPSLAQEMNTVTSLSVRKGAATPTVTLHLQGNAWTVAERADYPADVSKLRKLLLALSDAKLVEQKTSNPASFHLIGVDDPASPGASGAEVSFAAKDGNHAVIIGKPVSDGNFARRAGENTSYIVQPAISFEAEPRYWIDSRLIDIPTANIQSITVKPATGPAYTVHRAAPAGGGSSAAAGTSTATATGTSSAAAGTSTAATGTSSAAAGTSTAATGTSSAAAGTSTGAAGSSSAAAGAPPALPPVFVLDGIPPGRKAADSTVLAPSSSGYGNMTADDVRPAGEVDFSKATVATVTLLDGGLITLTGAAGGDKHWIRVQASKDAAVNAKAADRAFEIAGYRFDAIFRPVEQLLVPKEPPPSQPKKKSVPKP